MDDFDKRKMMGEWPVIVIPDDRIDADKVIMVDMSQVRLVDFKVCRRPDFYEESRRDFVTSTRLEFLMGIDWGATVVERDPFWEKPPQSFRGGLRYIARVVGYDWRRLRGRLRRYPKSIGVIKSLTT